MGDARKRLRTRIAWVGLAVAALLIVGTFAHARPQPPAATRTLTLPAEIVRAPLSGHPLAGLAVDDDGEPVASIQVRACWQRDAPDCVATEARGDDAGGFRLPWLADGSYALTVSAAGHATVVLPRVDVPSQGALRVVLERTATVRGLVALPDGEPAAKASIVAAGSGLWPPRTIEADAEGRFALDQLPGGVYELRASADIHVSPPKTGVLVEAGAVETVTLVLEKGRALRGRVVDADDEAPVANAEVSITERASAALPLTARTDANGEFTVAALRRAAHRVAVDAEGFVPLAGHALGETEAEVVLPVVRAATVRGVVVDEDGKPIADANVETLGEAQPVATANKLTITAPGELTVVPGPVPRIPLGGPDAKGLLGSGTTQRTDAEGRFEITRLPPGRINLLARAKGFAPTQSEAIELAAGALVQDARIVVRRGGELSGRVVDARGFPVGQVRLELRVRNEAFARGALSEPDGTFTFAAVLGETELLAHPLDLPSTHQSVRVGSGERREVVITLEGEARELAGRVLDARGFPVSGAAVELTALDAKARASHSAASDEDGTFRIVGLPKPPYRIRVRHLGFAPKTVARLSKVDGELAIRLQPAAALRGTLIDGFTGDPLAGVRVELSGAALDKPDSTRSGAQGEFEFSGLSAGNYKLLSRHEGFLQGRAKVVVHAGPKPTEGAKLVLAPAGILNGQVVDRLGAPVVNARVKAGGAVGRTDDEGRFRLTDVEPGELAVHAEHAQAGKAASAVAVRVYPLQETPGVLVRLPDIAH